MQMARARAVDMPISAAVEALIDGRIDAAHAVGALLARPLKGEDDA
jgi:glycerol-3-phosphate dehydrogenase